MAIAPGSTLGPYQIQSPLGAGGMGEVYSAADSRLGRQVAIKVLPTHFAADPVARERFEREARAIAALSHPNILAIFDFGEQDGLPYIVWRHRSPEVATGEASHATGKDELRKVSDAQVGAVESLLRQLAKSAKSDLEFD